MSDAILTDPRRQKLLLATVALGGFIINLDSCIVNVSLPTIARYFGVGTSAASGVTLAYLLVLTSTLLIFGRLGDAIGLKKVFLGGYLVFTLGSLLCGLSPTLSLLLASRCIQGLGGAMMFAIGPTLIPRYLPKDIRGWAFGMVATTMALGLTLGAPLGGFITDCMSWKWVFLVNVPVGFVAMWLTQRVLPGDPEKAAGQTFDMAGSVLSFLSIVALVLGLNRGEELGWASSVILTCFFLSILSFSVLILRERRIRNPLLDLGIFRNPDIAFAGWLNLLAFMVMTGANFLVPFYLAGVKGLCPAQTGMVLLLYSLAYGVLSLATGRLSDRIRPGILCGCGMLSVAAACAFFAFTIERPGLVPTLVFMTWLGFSYAMFTSPFNNLIMSLAPAEELGEVSGVFKTLTNLSFVLGVSLFETLFSLGVPAGLIREGEPPDDVILGLRRALVFGVAVSVLAFVLSMKIRPAARSPARMCGSGSASR
jgi:EmrB/QacA subfamily drug resistance transporter